MLRLSIGLGVEPGRQADGGSKQGTELLPEDRDYRETMEPEDVEQDHLCSFADESFGRDINWAILLNRSTTVRMTVLPSDVGRPVTKDIQYVQGRICGTMGDEAQGEARGDQRGPDVKACANYK